MNTILAVDDNEEMLEILLKYLKLEGYVVYPASTIGQAMEILAAKSPDLILTDVMLPDQDGFEFCRQIKQEAAYQAIPVIFMTVLQDEGSKIRGFEVGAADYITKPFHYDELRIRIANHLHLIQLQKSLKKANQELLENNQYLEKRVAEKTVELRKALIEVEKLKNQLEAENLYLKEEIKLNHNFEEIITQNEAFKKVLKKIEQVAVTDASVLILGETGTGKELLARAVHNISQRSKRPLVKLNCAALPAGLIESELFGHEKGAFTGAIARKLGKFELAHQGTIFLDEIGEMPLELQPKLLRVLQEGEMERLGSNHTLKVDVRVICATNRDLEKEIAEGRFREDLFYRLNVFPLNVPALRERKEDIPFLVQHFMQKFSAKIGKKIDKVSGHTLHKLKEYNWPGNIRELENVIERAVILSKGSNLQLDEWMPKSKIQQPKKKLQTFEEREKAHILEALEYCNWRVSGEKGAARLLGLNPKTLESKMRKLKIKKFSKNP